MTDTHDCERQEVPAAPFYCLSQQRLGWLLDIPFAPVFRLGNLCVQRREVLADQLALLLTDFFFNGRVGAGLGDI